MSCECEKTKRKHRSEEEYKSLINRLKRIEGQVGGIRRMIENDAYCIDVLTQVSAVSSALSAFSKELLASHIKGCVVENVKKGDGGAVDELVAALAKMI